MYAQPSSACDSDGRRRYWRAANYLSVGQIPNGEVAEIASIGIANNGAHFPRGGPVVTASGLVLVATASDKSPRAYDVDTGKVLWKTTVPNGSEGAAAIYE